MENQHGIRFIVQNAPQLKKSSFIHTLPSTTPRFRKLITLASCLALHNLAFRTVSLTCWFKTTVINNSHFSLHHDWRGLRTTCSPLNLQLLLIPFPQQGIIATGPLPSDSIPYGFKLDFWCFLRFIIVFYHQTYSDGIFLQHFFLQFVNGLANLK
jgi:hypothetical protein